jgi:hypothetical protein
MTEGPAWKERQRQLAAKSGQVHLHGGDSFRPGARLRFSDRVYVRDGNGSLRLVGPVIGR